MQYREDLYRTAPPAVGVGGAAPGSINARDAGVPITIDPAVIASGLTSLASFSSLIMTVQYYGKPSYPLPMTVSQDGLTATRMTLATDFPIGDDVLIQFLAYSPSGPRSSLVYRLTIGPRL